MAAHPFFVKFDRSLREMVQFLSTFKNVQSLKSIAATLEETYVKLDAINETRWLSRCKVLRHFADDMSIIQTFLENEKGSTNISLTYCSFFDF